MRLSRLQEQPLTPARDRAARDASQRNPIDSHGTAATMISASSSAPR
jgi:hypothetical protein